MSGFDVDLFVIGIGSGGVRAARIAAQHGAKVMAAEEYRIGGTCVIRGCVPKKLLVYASRFADDFQDAAGYGWTVGPVTFDWGSMIAAKDKEIARLSAIYETNLDKAGVAIERGRAVVEGPNTVRLLRENRKVTARHILVATGGAPVLEPAIPGIEHAITSNEIFNLARLPAKIIIAGGGYIAVEFASLLARLGSEVTLMMRGDNVLRGFDADMRDGLREALTHAGVKLRFGTLPARIDKAAAGLDVTLSDGTRLGVDQIMIATGRRPATRGLGLETAGVALDGAGAVKVDAHSRSNVASIHAVGDVTNRINLTPVAIREGHLLADHLFSGKTLAADHTNVPSAVFTTPEIGTVGLTEEQARAAHKTVDIYRTSFRPMKAILPGRAEKTIMKIVVDGETDKVLGVHILGHEAGEMAQLLGIAVKMGATKADFDATMAVHPTASEELVTMRTRTERHVRE